MDTNPTPILIPGRFNVPANAEIASFRHWCGGTCDYCGTVVERCGHGVSIYAPGSGCCDGMVEVEATWELRLMEHIGDVRYELCHGCATAPSVEAARARRAAVAAG
jgi:hypothetical protein